MRVLFTKTPEETYNAGRELGSSLKGGEIISFTGDLGAGKTVFIQGICDSLNVDDYVNSPTYTLVNEYQGNFRVLHFDCYRLESPEEFELLGYQDSMDDPEFVSLIEWGEIIDDILPEAIMRINIIKLTFEKRKITIEN